MATFTKQAFSVDADGQGILVAATATPGTSIHVTPADTITIFDEIWIYATNNDSSAVNLTIEFGDTTNVIKLSVPATSGLTVIVPGLILGPAMTVAAFASVTNKISVFGYVNRIF